MQRPASELSDETQKIAVRVKKGELTQPYLAAIETIPALFDWQLRDESRGEDPLVKRRSVSDRDLKFDAPPVRTFERREAKAPSGTLRFLQHQMRPVEGEIGEALLRALVANREADEADVEFQRLREIAHVEFGNEPRASHLRHLEKKTARSLRSARFL